eukprot:gene8610-biopygen13684
MVLLQATHPVTLATKGARCPNICEERHPNTVGWGLSFAALLWAFYFDQREMDVLHKNEPGRCNRHSGATSVRSPWPAKWTRQVGPPTRQVGPPSEPAKWATTPLPLRPVVSGLLTAATPASSPLLVRDWPAICGRVGERRMRGGGFESADAVSCLGSELSRNFHAGSAYICTMDTMSHCYAGSVDALPTSSDCRGAWIFMFQPPPAEAAGMRGNMIHLLHCPAYCNITARYCSSETRATSASPLFFLRVGEGGGSEAAPLSPVPPVNTREVQQTQRTAQRAAGRVQRAA